MGAKVVHVLYSGLTGLGRVVFQLLESAELVGYPQTVLFWGEVEPVDSYRHELERLNVEYAWVQKRAGFRLGDQINFLQALRALRPDVLMLHIGLTTLPVLTLPRTFRLLVVEHGTHVMGGWRKKADLALSQLVADRIVKVYPGQERQLRKSFPIFAPLKFREAFNGVDLRRFSRKKPRQGPWSTLRVGMHARFERAKDHHHLLHAWRAFRQFAPGLEAKLLLAGEGALKESVELEARGLGLEDTVEFVGALSLSQVPEFLHSLDLYVFFTWGETLSMALLEAQACGLPTIATRAEGVSEHLAGEAEGLLVERKDSEGFCASMERFLKDEVLREQMSHRARNFVETQFSAENAAFQYRQLLQEFSPC